MTLSLAAVGTVAWFVYQDHVEAISSSARIQVISGELDISDDEGKTWGVEIRYTNSPFKYLIDVSGDGQTFWFPNKLNASDEPETIASNWTEITKDNCGGFMICYDIWFRTTDVMDVYLSDASFVTSDEEYVTGSDFDYARRSSYGNISCDGIVGASRVSFVDITDENSPELKFVWVPNDTYRLSYAEFRNMNQAFYSTEGKIYRENIDSDTMEVITGYGPYETGESLITRESLRPRLVGANLINGYQYYYLDSSSGQMKLNTYSAADYASGRVTVDSSWLAYTALDGTTWCNRGIPVLSFRESSDAPTVKKLRVNIWFEGTDNEANKALNGGQIKYKLSFIGINKLSYGFDLASAVDGEETEPDAAGKRKVFWQWDTDSQTGDRLNTGRLVYTVEGGAVQEWGTESGVNYPDLLRYTVNGVEWFDYKNSGTVGITPGAEAYYIYVQIAESESSKASNVVKVEIPAIAAP